MRDYRFHCEDCDSYRQCQYYHNRKGTSLICKEFQHGSSVIEQIRNEIVKTLYIRPKNKYEEGLKDQALKDMEILDKYLG